MFWILLSLPDVRRLCQNKYRLVTGKNLYTFGCLLQIERIQEGQPGKYRVTAKSGDGKEIVDEYNTVCTPHH